MKWWHWGLIGFVGLAVIIAIIDPEAYRRAPAESEAASKAAPPQITKLNDLVGVMIVPGAAPPETLLSAAKDYCGARPHCSVYGWRRAEDASRAMPMTEREVASRVFAYDLNRSTGFERALWNCREFPRQHREECIAS